MSGHAMSAATTAVSKETRVSGAKNTAQPVGEGAEAGEGEEEGEGEVEGEGNTEGAGVTAG